MAGATRRIRAVPHPHCYSHHEFVERDTHEQLFFVDITDRSGDSASILWEPARERITIKLC